MRIVVLNYRIAVIGPEDGVCIAGEEDIKDLMAWLSWEHDCTRVVLEKACVAEALFDLRTGLLGAALEKCVQYGWKVAVVGDFSVYTSRALRDFIYESNQGRTAYFVGMLEDALEMLNDEPL